jgi:hypothetical protein
MFLDSKCTPIQEDDIITCVDPYSKKEMFGRALFKQVRDGKSFWFIYIPQSKAKKLVFMTEKLAEACTVVGNYTSKPEEWEFLMHGVNDSA